MAPTRTRKSLLKSPRSPRRSARSRKTMSIGAYADKPRKRKALRNLDPNIRGEKPISEARPACVKIAAGIDPKHVALVIDDLINQALAAKLGISMGVGGLSSRSRSHLCSIFQDLTIDLTRLSNPKEFLSEIKRKSGLKLGLKNKQGHDFVEGTIENLYEYNRLRSSVKIGINTTINPNKPQLGPFATNSVDIGARPFGASGLLYSLGKSDSEKQHGVNEAFGVQFVKDLTGGRTSITGVYTILGIIRNANSSCRPNCRLVKGGNISTGGVVRAYLLAIKPIVPGDELTIDYGKEYFEGCGLVCSCEVCRDTPNQLSSPPPLVASIHRRISIMDVQEHHIPYLPSTPTKIDNIFVGYSTPSLDDRPLTPPYIPSRESLLPFTPTANITFRKYRGETGHRRMLGQEAVGNPLPVKEENIDPTGDTASSIVELPLLADLSSYIFNIHEDDEEEGETEDDLFLSNVDEEDNIGSFSVGQEDGIGEDVWDLPEDDEEEHDQFERSEDEGEEEEVVGDLTNDWDADESDYFREDSPDLSFSDNIANTHSSLESFPYPNRSTHIISKSVDTVHDIITPDPPHTIFATDLPLPTECICSRLPNPITSEDQQTTRIVTPFTRYSLDHRKAGQAITLFGIFTFLLFC